MSLAMAIKELSVAKTSHAQAVQNLGIAVRHWKIAIAVFARCRLDELHFSDVACTANRHGGHVYKHNGSTNKRRGFGRYECVFCLLDDWEE